MAKADARTVRNGMPGDSQRLGRRRLLAVTLAYGVREGVHHGSIELVETLIEPARVGQGNVVREPSDQTLEALTQAYAEPAERRVT